MILIHPYRSISVRTAPHSVQKGVPILSYDTLMCIVRSFCTVVAALSSEERCRQRLVAATTTYSTHLLKIGILRTIFPYQIRLECNAMTSRRTNQHALTKLLSYWSTVGSVMWRHVWRHFLAFWMCSQHLPKKAWWWFAMDEINSIGSNDVASGRTTRISTRKWPHLQ